MRTARRGCRSQVRRAVGGEVLDDRVRRRRWGCRPMRGSGTSATPRTRRSCSTSPRRRDHGHTGCARVEHGNHLITTGAQLVRRRPVASTRPRPPTTPGTPDLRDLCDVDSARPHRHRRHHRRRRDCTLPTTPDRQAYRHARAARPATRGSSLTLLVNQRGTGKPNRRTGTRGPRKTRRGAATPPPRSTPSATRRASGHGAEARRTHPNAGGTASTLTRYAFRAASRGSPGTSRRRGHLPGV